jgi:hypothetical protein
MFVALLVCGSYLLTANQKGIVILPGQAYWRVCIKWTITGVSFEENLPYKK